MEKRKFFVLMWDFNGDNIEHYDVLPYLRNCYKDTLKQSKKKSVQKSQELMEYYKVPNTKEEFKKFIENKSCYQFWSRCEYEMICHGWPVQKNDYKIDVHEQIMMNVDTIADILMEEFN